MVLIENDIKTFSTQQLKKLCKIYKLTNYYKLKKNELFKLVNTQISVIKIQRYIRRLLMGMCNDPICLISMEPIRFPCYSFKPKGSTYYVYYNLNVFIDYLLQTGDFRDPKTREPYTDDFLKKVDAYKKKLGIKSKSVYQASQNLTIYKKKREHEDEIMVLDRCIDEVVSSIIGIMERRVDDQTDPRIILNSYHFPTYLRYYKRLLQKCSFSGKLKIKSTIRIITDRHIMDPNFIQDFILQFMYTIETTYESQFS